MAHYFLSLLTLAIGDSPNQNLSENMGRIAGMVLGAALVLWIIQKLRDRGKKNRS